LQIRETSVHCSVTMSDRRAASQYHSYVAMLRGGGATRPN